MSANQGPDQITETRIRARYTKTGKLRFVSAIDLGRLWERALRKAQLPIAYSEGFSPHPKVSFPDALPLGYASTGEYAELTLAASVPLEAAVKALNAAFPDGIEVLHAVEVPHAAPRIAKWLIASVWDLDYSAGVDEAALAAAVGAALAADALAVSRRRKDEVTEVDVRPAIVALAAQRRTVRALVRHVEPPVRPTELHAALAGPYEQITETALTEPALATRVAQGTPNGDTLSEALTGAAVAVQPPDREDDLNRE